MTTTPTTADDLAIALTKIEPHPSNPRSDLRDLDTLIKSVRQVGVLQPLTVLPANANGIHHIVAGHRRYAAAIEAELETVPCVIRELTDADVLIAMLTENRQRDDLTISEEVQALRDIDGLDDKPSRKQLAKQLGVSTAWLRSRFKLVALPADILSKVDNGDITVAQAEAASTLADLGDDAIADFTQKRFYNQDPTEAANDWRRTHEAKAKAAQVAADYQAKGITVWANGDKPVHAKPVADLGLDDDAAAEHQTKDCHGVTIAVTNFGTATVRVTHWCAKPRSCKPKTGPDPQRLADNARIAAAKARKAALIVAFAAKKPTKTQAAQLTPAAYVHNRVGHTEYDLVARVLGDTDNYPLNVIATHTANGEDIHHLAVLLAFAAAESQLNAKHSHGPLHPSTDAYLAYITTHGDWEDHDGWTAKRIKTITANN